MTLPMSIHVNTEIFTPELVIQWVEHPHRTIIDPEDVLKLIVYTSIEFVYAFCILKIQLH